LLTFGVHTTVDEKRSKIIFKMFKNVEKRDINLNKTLVKVE